MALIKTIAEIKEVLPKMVSNLSNNTLLPNFTHTEGKYIVPLIGQDLYDTLVTNYNAETLDADETDLVKKLRVIIASYAYYDDFGLYILTFTDGGAQKIKQGGAEPIRGWEAMESKRSLLNKAYDGIEVLLNYLFEKKELFPEWVNSEQYARIAKLLLRTGSEFNDNYTLFQPQRTFFILKSVMADVQERFLEESIGKSLLAYLRDLDEPEDEEAEALRLLKKSLAFYSVMKACRHFSVAFTENGFTIIGEKNSNPIEQQANQVSDRELLQMKINECEVDGGSYLEKARDELVKYYNDGAGAGFKLVFEEGPLMKYIQHSDRTSGNENRKIYTMP